MTNSIRTGLPPHVSITAAMLALSGGVVMVALCLGEGANAVYGHDLTELARAAAIGAGIAGLFLAGLFGREGGLGLALATLGAGLATSLGAALAGALVLGAEGLGLGPVFVLGGLVQSPLAILIWGAAMFAVHAISQAERHRTDV